VQHETSSNQRRAGYGRHTWNRVRFEMLLRHFSMQLLSITR